MNGSYFIIFSNFAVCPTVFYLFYRSKYIYACQIGLNAIFSMLHHFPVLGVPPWDNKWREVFTFIDAYLSYLSIYVFSIYFFLHMAFSEVMVEFYLTHLLLLLLITSAMDSYTIITSTVLSAISTMFIHIYQLRALYLWNPYLWLALSMACGDLACFFIALYTDYALFHSLHHLLAFTLPLSIEWAVSWTVIDLEGL